MADTDCASESASSICDEERIKRLFQACDANGDGYIDSQDLAAICRELSLEDSLDELMLQLGADALGRISYDQFLKRRLALRPEIDALKVSNKDNLSENSQSQGKLDKWEWDSGARDMSPIHKSHLRDIDDIMENEIVKGDLCPLILLTEGYSVCPIYLAAQFLQGVLYKHFGIEKDERLAATVEFGGDKSCLTTYVFNPAETCTGFPSPEKSPLNTSLCESDSRDAKRALQVERHMHPNFLFGKILQDGKPNFLTDYELSYKHCNFDVGTHGKCCVGGHFGEDLSFGHLYTISRSNKEERMYDEPCTGDLPRRSWLCCPGSQRKDGEQPALLDIKKELTPSPPDAITREPSRTFCSGTCERLQQQLDEQAQRYEEQLTELHSVIAELTRKLHHQRTMAIAEEDEISESCTSVHDDSVTCPLEVSELEPLEHDMSDLDNRIHLAESPLELPEPKLNTSNIENNESSPSVDVEPLKQEIARLKCLLQGAQLKLAQYAHSKEEIMEEMTNESKNMESPESHIEIDCRSFQGSSPKIDIKYSNIVPIHRSKQNNNSTVSTPVSKVAERIKLKRTTDGHVDSNTVEGMNADLTTAVAEHIVGDILRHCDAQNEKTPVDIELRQLYSKLEHARAQNNVLFLTLSETKAHCDRLALLCGKYESNAVALRLALGVTDRAIEAYDVLLALLETELALNEENDESIQNRSAAETVAKQLLTYLDSYEISSDMLLSPWQNHVYDSSKLDNSEQWTSEHETRLREHVSRLKAERSNIQGTYVALESTYVDNVPVKPLNNQESRKMDLEMAVLLQELMSLREEKVELLTKLFALEKDKSAIHLKLKYVEGQQKAQTATLKNLQGQLKDTEALLALASQNRERGYSDAEHAQGVELELMQALAREARLKVRLQELVSTLEQVTKNAEARLLEGREIVHDLNQTNSILAETVDKNNKRYQAKFKKMEQQMLTLVERHTAQVHTLQQRIASMETPPTNSSDNSLASVAV